MLVLSVGRPAWLGLDLGRDRHAVQRRQRLAPRAGGISLVGRGARLFLEHAHHSVNRRIDPCAVGPALN